MTIQTTASNIANLDGKAILCAEHLGKNQAYNVTLNGQPKLARVNRNRIEAALARSFASRDTRTLDDLQRLALHTGERMIRIAPHHGVFEAALNEISYAYATGNASESGARVTGLAVFLLDCDALGYTEMTREERRDCQGLIARHYAG